MKSNTKAAKKSVKRAEQRAVKAAEVAQERAAELADRAGAIAQDAAHEFAERLRESDALAKAQKKGVALAGAAQVKGGEIADLAKAKWSEAELDQRAAELAKQVRQSDAAREASKKARDLTDTSLAAVGGWLASGKGAEKLGLAPKRRVPALVWALLGVAIGFVAAKVLADKSDGGVRDDLAAAADRLAAKAPHPAGTVLADTIRTTLQGDPRTADLRQVNINVAEGTVFVRGSIPSGIDTAAVRSVIESVPGVEDVDLQLTPAV